MNDIMPVLVFGFGEKLSHNGTQYYQQRRVYDARGNNIAMAHPSQINKGSYMYLVEEENELFEGQTSND